MIDMYLRCADEGTLNAALGAAGLLCGTDEPEIVPGALLDRIGAVTGAEGYHANLRLMFDPMPEQLADLDAVTIAAPRLPFRVWA